MIRNNFYIVWAVVIYLLFVLYSYFYIDLPVAKFFRVYENSLFENTLTTLSTLGEAGWYIVGGLMIYYYFKNKKPLYSQRAMFIVKVVVLSGIVSGVIKVTVGRFRPVKFFRDNLYGFDGWHFNEYKFNSFPSGHTTTGFAIGVALALLFPKYRFYFLLFAFFIGFTRVATTVHYVSDTLMGALIGTFTAVLCFQKFKLKDLQ